MRTGLFSLAAMLLLAPTALAQQNADERDAVVVWYTSHNCGAVEPGTPGANRESAITVQDFGDLYDAAISEQREVAGEAPAPSQYECRWVRLTGFLDWMNYYHYRGALLSNAWASYSGGEVRYIVERFQDPTVRRGNLVRRRVTLVGRFYDLCAAASRARAESDDEWIMLLGPCHYGYDNGLMLDDVAIEEVHDDAPRYILGEANRTLFAELPRIESTERAALVERTRAWAALLRQGLSPYADAYFAARPALARRPEEEQRETRERLESPEGYPAYAAERLARTNVRRASVEVFWNGRYSERQDEAVGCICLASSCGDAWPLTAADAEYFVGDAVCTEFERGEDGLWRWR